MAEFGLLNWGIVIGFLLVNLGLGFAVSSRIDSAGDYSLGDKSSPWWAIGISVIATYVSALTFLGGPAWAYGDGMAALAIHVNYPLVIFVVVVFYLPFFYNSGVASIYEYLERRFGRRTRLAISAVFLVSQGITSATILTATAIVLTYITGFDARWAIVILTLTVLLYTLMGGMNAVIWTDVLQGIILFLGAGLIFYYLLGSVSPISGALERLAADGRLDPINADLDFSVAPTIWAGVFAMTLFHITVYGGNQMMVQRTLAAKTIGDAKKSYLMMGYAGFFIYFLFFFIGALLYVHFDARPFEQPNEIILIYANSLGLPGLMGVLASAIMAASMSSLSSAFNSLATVTVEDFYKPSVRKQLSDRHYLMALRIFTCLWALLSIPLAFAFIASKGSILETLTELGAYLVGAQLATFGLGFFSKHTSERGLLIGIVAGFVAILVANTGIPAIGFAPPAIAWPWFVVIGGTVNIAVTLATSLILDGRQAVWHEHSVPGQIAHFSKSGKPEKVAGWYQVPGRIEKPTGMLLVFFVLVMLFLLAFGRLA